MKLNFRNKTTQLYSILLLFITLYCIISLVNHYLFKTNALDLGVYTNAMYDYINFQWNDSTAFKAVPENLLADHFDLYLILFSTLVLLFGTYTLLIVQIVAVVIGAIGVFRFFEIEERTRSVSLWGALFFCSFFGVFSALAFDYHSNVVAACAVPWFFYHVKKNQWWKAGLVLLFIWIGKENMSFWMVFVCTGLMITYFKNTQKRYLLGCAALLSLVYFFTIVKFVMPMLSVDGAYPHFHYSSLGDNFSEAFVFLFKHPLDSIQMMFTNHIDHPYGDYVKLETHLFLLLSGLPLLIFKPQYLLMLVPIYFQKMYHDNYMMWSMGGQYSIEFAPILAIGIFSVVSDFKNKKTKLILSIVLLVLVIGITIRSMDNTVVFTNKSAVRFYQASHYERAFDVGKLHDQLGMIPDNAIVSAQSPFLPHLALRDKVYLFPTVKDAEYLIFSLNESSYPITPEELEYVYNHYKNHPDWELIYDDWVMIFKRK